MYITLTLSLALLTFFNDNNNNNNNKLFCRLAAIKLNVIIFKLCICMKSQRQYLIAAVYLLWVQPCPYSMQSIYSGGCRTYTRCSLYTLGAAVYILWVLRCLYSMQSIYSGCFRAHTRCSLYTLGAAMPIVDAVYILLY